MPGSRASTPLWSLVGILVVVAAWFWWLVPTARTIRSVSAEATELATTRSDLEARHAYLATMATQIPAHKDEARLIQLAAPTDPSYPELLAALEAMATASGVTLVQVQPQAANTDPSQVVMNVGVSGTYEALASFIRASEAFVRPMGVRSLSVTTASSVESTALVTATISFGVAIAPSGGQVGGTSE